jgi:hypothetical protein
MSDSVRRTVGAVHIVTSRWDTRFLLIGSALVYLLGYSFAVGDLALTGSGGVSLTVVADPLERALQPIGYFSFEPIAAIEVGPITYLFSPIDTALAVVLAVLVGMNVALSYVGVMQPCACGMESSLGVLAAVPALLSGVACCGPVVLVVIGVQATGLLISGFQLLLPIAVILLVFSLILIGRQTGPPLA